MTVDVLFLARNRKEFTMESMKVLLANTDWNLVSTLYVYDDQSVDGTKEYLQALCDGPMPVRTVFRTGVFNVPNLILMDCVEKSTSDLIAKIDNDALMPEGWINIGLKVMEDNSELNLLGIAYRGASFAEYGEVEFGFEPARFIGGIGIFRRECLQGQSREPSEKIQYRGINQAHMNVGWINPSLPVVLLNQIPFEPWCSYAESYIARGWQRWSGRYGRERFLWNWWQTRNKVSRDGIFSPTFWEQRYKDGGGSGGGSRGPIGEKKSEFVNAFVQRHAIESVIDFGCGEGEQLASMHLPSYLGLDVSPTAIAFCRERFQGDLLKRFCLLDPGLYHPPYTADLTLSMDVIFHLVEDWAYEAHLSNLFEAATRFVIIYSNDIDSEAWDSLSGGHIKHRKFTKWVERNKRAWVLVGHEPNAFPFDWSNPGAGSWSEFFVYARRD